jgi:uncharacterized membrane protein (DUF2068 family)
MTTHEGSVMSNRPARRRPFGVSVIIGMQLLSFLSAAFGLAVEYAAIVAHVELEGFAPTFTDNVMLVLELVLSLVSVYGLWRMQRWAWFITMLDLGVSMCIGLYLYYYGDPDYWTMFFNVVMVFYLNQREVQNAFVRKRREVRTG